MLKNLFLLVCLTMLVTCAVAGGDDGSEQNRELAEFQQRSDLAVKSFASELKNELMKAISSGGPAHAVGVCSERAQQIAEAAGIRHGVHIGRTSLKTRNPGNRPSEWETKMLMQFEQALSNGVATDKLSIYETYDEDGKTAYRHMRGIVTADICVMCHGSPESMSSDLRTELQRLYPQDQALGFKSGDLRGAFTVYSDSP